MTMKLYSWDLSPYAARVRMQIYAKGLTDIATEQTPFYLTQKFYEDRPLSRIPSLEIDGDTIPESAVIAEYLEEIYPEPSLLGSTPRENAHIRTLARIGDVYLISTAFMLASQTGILAAQTPVPTGIESIVALLSGQLASSIRTLDRMMPRRLRLPRPPHPSRLRARTGALLCAAHAAEQGARRPDRRERQRGRLPGRNPGTGACGAHPGRVPPRGGGTPRTD
jgi:hypothetical protein